MTTDYYEIRWVKRLDRETGAWIHIAQHLNLEGEWEDFQPEWVSFIHEENPRSGAV